MAPSIHSSPLFIDMVSKAFVLLSSRKLFYNNPWKWYIQSVHYSLISGAKFAYSILIVISSI